MRLVVVARERWWLGIAKKERERERERERKKDEV